MKLLESWSHCNPNVTPALKISLSISKSEKKTVIEFSTVTTFSFMGLGYWIRKDPHMFLAQFLPQFSQINFVYVLSMVSEQSLSQWQRGQFSNPPQPNSWPLSSLNFKSFSVLMWPFEQQVWQQSQTCLYNILITYGIASVCFVIPFSLIYWNDILANLLVTVWRLRCSGI